jgi:acetyl esterase/lipase
VLNTRIAQNALGALALWATVLACEDASETGRDPTDAAHLDAQLPDARTPDAQRPDAQSNDARTPDAQLPDAQSNDARTPDAQLPDAQPSDARPEDARPEDARPEDARPEDAQPAPDQGLPACADPVVESERRRDLPYGPEDRQVFDLYLPTPGAAPPPVFVWIHGGGWQGGSHSQVPAPVGEMVRRGIAVASVEYRLSDHPFPTPISDVRAALRWLEAHGAEVGIDGTRLAVGGSSAGGHLSAILGTASDVLALDVDPQAGPAPRPLLVVDFFGPSDLLQMHPDSQASGCPAGAICHECAGSPEALLIDCPAELSTCPETANLASPVTHVDHNDSPFLVLHGSEDCVVPTPQGQRMQDALQAAGVPLTLTVVPGAGHNVAQVGTPEVWQAVYRALDAHLKGCLAPEAPAPPPPEPTEISACAQAACPQPATACAADPACLAIEACIQECFGTMGCPASCTAGQPPAPVQTHRTLFECARPAGCY